MEEFDKITSQMKKGVLEYLILAIVEQGSVYASDILAKLKESNLLIVEGTLYPLLSRIKTEGSVQYNRVESLQGPPRKYYTLTTKGTRLLEHMRSTRSDLAKAVNTIDK